MFMEKDIYTYDAEEILENSDTEEVKDHHRQMNKYLSKNLDQYVRWFKPSGGLKKSNFSHKTLNPVDSKDSKGLPAKASNLRLSLKGKKHSIAETEGNYGEKISNADCSTISKYERALFTTTE